MKTTGQEAADAIQRALSVVEIATTALQNTRRWSLWETNPPSAERDPEANLDAAILALEAAQHQLRIAVAKRQEFLQELNLKRPQPTS